MMQLVSTLLLVCLSPASAAQLRGKTGEEPMRFPQHKLRSEFDMGADAYLDHVDFEEPEEKPEETFYDPGRDPDFMGSIVTLDPPKDEGSDSLLRPRIIGGTDSPGQPNFCMHLRGSSGSYRAAGCGGTLISNCHVLSAAHCSADSRASLPNALYCNAYNPFSGNKGQPYHFTGLAGKTIHPDFNNDGNANDVAVLKLSTCVSDWRNTYPLMGLADKEFVGELRDGASVKVSGFGRTAENDSTQVRQLQVVTLPFITHDTCKDYYGNDVLDDMVCAGRSAGGIDSCSGDSGGPLFVEQGGKQTQIGVVSWGRGCARANQPGVYANVGDHHDWIREQVCSDPDTDPRVPLCAGYDTPEPTPSPTKSPTQTPTKSPTAAPTNSPTRTPTRAPSAFPSEQPSLTPTMKPSPQPSDRAEDDTRSCQLDGPCWTSENCCGGQVCLPRDGRCVTLSKVPDRPSLGDSSGAGAP